ncbi:hypothetical protein CkaCkLH20_08890 [Colletotrichum karsti]|uniref:Uncharacterized protein n=1 Tax=Colletotrichum karsti TaxID=1095194 RepID=A0A9P6LIJ5_9PEZI|nr:uncharacterized protein CkaCkLH20_08890 [Colletotrichum karsti]KAF9873780.1 hypothetical protein CkaCkLH20_08890 [Colletotrichum karsti]
MAPVIASILRRAQAAQDTTPTPTPEADSGLGLGGTPGNDESAPATNTTTILIIVIVICGAAIMSAALFYIFDRKKNSQFREACKRDPYLTRKEFTRRRKLSALERLEEEELQRSIMIRKSLACRTPSTGSRGSSDEDSDSGETQMQQHQRLPEPLYDPHHHDQTSRSGWAPSEARRARSDSESSSSASLGRPYAEPHPGVEVEVPLPPRSRSPSPVRTPLIRKPVPPPMPAIYVPAGESPRHLRTLSRGSDIPLHLQ